MNDLAFAGRTLRKDLGFSAIAVLTLALGIGANTAIFSIVKAVLLDPLPYRQPDRLVLISETDPQNPRPITIDFPTTVDLRSRSGSFENMSLYRDGSAALADRGGAELLHGLRVNYNYFDTLGVKMYLGRSFLPQEDRPDRRYVVILSHGLWVRRFGADRHIIGRVIRLSEASYTVAGVLPAGFRPPVPPDYRGAVIEGSDLLADIYVPLGYDFSVPYACRGCQHLQLIARLKPGVTPGQAQAELTTLLAEIVREHPKDYEAQAGIAVTPLRDDLVGQAGSALWVPLGAVAVVLLIACANVMNLLLVRASGRTREIALRAALGAGRRRLVRQLLTESLLLALLGGAGGVLLAMWATSALAGISPIEIPRVDEVRIDGAVLLFALAASLLTGIVFGVAPALRASRIDLNDALKDFGRSTNARSQGRSRTLIAALEFALAFVLVAGAGLLGKSFVHLVNVNPGFDAHNVLTLRTYVYGARFEKPQVELNYYQQALARVRAVPGVEDAAMTSLLPMSGGFDHRTFEIRERPLANEADAPNADTYSVSPDYFRVMRIPLKQGRTFTDSDRQGAPLVAIVSESCARSQFPAGDAIGKHIQLGPRRNDKPWATIVGIVGDVRQYGFERPSSMEVYVAQAQNLSFAYKLVARTAVDPKRVAGAVRQAFFATDKTLPVYDMAPLEFYLQSSVASRKFTVGLLALFGALALTLAAIGIYGVISYAVTERTREVGIRLALGAQKRDVFAMVLRSGLAVAAIGLGSGLLTSLLVTRVLANMLYDVSPTDLATAAGVALTLTVVALAASYIPARRAMNVDPLVALRYE